MGRTIDADELRHEIERIPFMTNNSIMRDIVSMFRDKILRVIDEQPTILTPIVETDDSDEMTSEEYTAWLDELQQAPNGLSFSEEKAWRDGYQRGFKAKMAAKA